ITVVARLLARRHGRLAHRLDLVLALVGVVRLAGGNQLVGHLPVSLQPPRLVERTLVGVEVEPVHCIQDRLHRFAGGALPIGILDAQDELATAAARLQPAIQCGARAANMQETGGTGCEAGAYGHGCLRDMRGERMDFSRYRSDHPKRRSLKPCVGWPVALALLMLGWVAMAPAWADNPGYDRPGLGFNPATLDAGELTLELHFGDSFYNHLQLSGPGIRQDSSGRGDSSVALKPALPSSSTSFSWGLLGSVELTDGARDFRNGQRQYLLGMALSEQ